MKNPTRAAGAPVDGAPYLAYGPPAPTVSGYPPPAGYGFADPYAAGPGPAGAKKRGAGQVILVILLSLVGLVLALAVLGFVGYRMFGGQQVVAADPHEVEVTLPTHLHGWTKMEGKAETQMLKQVTASVPDQIETRGAVYGRAGVYQAVIIVEPRRLNLFQQKSLLQQDVRAAKKDGFTVRAVPAGPLGGLMQCGRTADGGQTICGFADDGLYANVYLLVPAKNYLATVYAVRAAIEHRLG